VCVCARACAGVRVCACTCVWSAIISGTACHCRRGQAGRRRVRGPLCMTSTSNRTMCTEALDCPQGKHRRVAVVHRSFTHSAHRGTLGFCIHVPCPSYGRSTRCMEWWWRTARHHTVAHCTAPHCGALHGTTLWRTARHHTMAHCTAPHCGALHGTTLWHTAQHHTWCAPHGALWGRPAVVR